MNNSIAHSSAPVRISKETKTNELSIINYVPLYKALPWVQLQNYSVWPEHLVSQKELQNTYRKSLFGKLSAFNCKQNSCLTGALMNGLWT